MKKHMGHSNNNNNNNNNNMKKKKQKKSSRANKLRGPQSVMISKKKDYPEEQILKQIKEYVLYTRLRSLVPPTLPSEIKGSENVATEIELDCEEAPERESDEESNGGVRGRGSDGEIGCGEGCCRVVFESEEEDVTEEFVPSVKIRVLEESLLISTIVDKDIALASELFRILEEENEIDIVFENQYRTESRVAYTIQVKVLPDYKVELLEKKLCRWAGKPMF
ncbi:hypothetical protein Syun_016356 [Stephania yunnanensis]|uniref:Uncharacterized protein n=1 Tax=Stephania yunnanensis TaxID=152371 RepID=A0AAP0J4W1_9MAGN